MGYYVTLLDADFIIPETEEVLNVLKELNNGNEDIKRGGSYGGSGKREFWFSWMPADFSVFTTVASVFEALGFETKKIEEISVEHPYERVALVGYDSKTGQEDIFIEAVAPFVEHGNHLEWRGEQGEVWRDLVLNGTYHRQDANLVFGDPYRAFAMEEYKRVMESINKMRGVTDEKASVSEVS